MIAEASSLARTAKLCDRSNGRILAVGLSHDDVETLRSGATRVCEAEAIGSHRSTEWLKWVNENNDLIGKYDLIVIGVKPGVPLGWLAPILKTAGVIVSSVRLDPPHGWRSSKLAVPGAEIWRYGRTR